MTKEERLNIKIENKEQITLSNSSEFVKLTAIIVSLLCLIFVSLILYFFKIKIESILLIFTFLIVYLLFIVQLKEFVSASIKDEMLITKNIFNTKKITSIKSIKSISSKTLFNVDFTKVTYKLDGTKYSIRIIQKIDSEHLKNEEIIKTILKIAC
jgi:cellulose synthase/poly-beta-1,6-N-acetylglucosamine synthase-like glycosyltransferase